MDPPAPSTLLHQHTARHTHMPSGGGHYGSPRRCVAASPQRQPAPETTVCGCHADAHGLLHLSPSPRPFSPWCLPATALARPWAKGRWVQQRASCHRRPPRLPPVRSNPPPAPHAAPCAQPYTFTAPTHGTYAPLPPRRTRQRCERMCVRVHAGSCRTCAASACKAGEAPGSSQALMHFGGGPNRISFPTHIRLALAWRPCSQRVW